MLVAPKRKKSSTQKGRVVVILQPTEQPEKGGQKLGEFFHESLRTLFLFLSPLFLAYSSYLHP